MRHLLLLLFVALVPSASAGDWPCWRGPHHDGIAQETVKSWPAAGPKVLWRADLTGGYSSMVVASGRLFTQTKDKKEDLVICFDALTGKRLWEHRYACDYTQYPSLDKRFLTGPKATPTVDGNYVYAMGNTGLLQCFDVKSGKLVWERDLLRLAGRSCPDYGYCGVLLRLEPEGDPEVVWKNKAMQNHFSTSVLYEGHLYGFSADRLRCVEFKTGDVKWDKPGLGKGSLLVAGGQLIALGEHGTLVLAQATPKAYAEAARWQALDGICWSVPVLANGTLYLRNEKQVLAVDLRD